MKKILEAIGSFFSFIIPFSFCECLSSSFSYIYYGWVKKKFKRIGNVYFKLPLYLTNPQYIEIGSGTTFGKRVIICATDQHEKQQLSPKIIIGENCNIGDDCNIQCCNTIIIGSNVLFGKKIMINDSSHGVFIENQLRQEPMCRPICSKGPIIIDDNVWIGEMSCILQNVHIGEGAVIGAHSVVTKDIPSYSLAVGVPAKVIKKINMS